jgi:hypothetical protein
VIGVSIFGKFLHPDDKINASGTSSKAFLGGKKKVQFRHIMRKIEN